MKNFVYGLALAFAAFFLYTLFYAEDKQASKTETTELLAKHIQQVGKLVVTEGHFSEVITYKDAKKMMLDLYLAEKKAIIIVNASVAISYDLHKLNYAIDDKTKSVRITQIPKPEIQITPAISYHSIQDNLLNPFTPSDHNAIHDTVSKVMRQKIKKSNLYANSKNRLLSELYSLLTITRFLGWKLVYDHETISANKK